MPIRPYLLEGAAFEPEAISVISVAFESVCAELDLSDKDDPAMRLVAIRAERHPGCCTAAVHDTQGIQAQLVVEARRFLPPWTAEETDGLNSKTELPSTARATGAAAPAASPLGGDAPGLVAGDQLCRRQSQPTRGGTRSRPRLLASSASASASVASVGHSSGSWHRRPPRAG